jgi:deoxyribonuclease V
MDIKHLHKWEISPQAAAALQKSLRSEIVFSRFDSPLQTVGGLDCALSRDKKNIIACVVVLSAENFEIIESAYSVERLKFPYVPGLLSFRELPVCLSAMEKLQKAPNAVIVDGQGIAHPRRFGLACHLGLFIDIPTIGCAKSRLIGEFDEPASKKGSESPLKDGDEIIGTVLRTRNNARPLFVSVGNRCRLQDAVRIVLACCTKYRLPEPSRLAHQIAAKLKNII